MDKSCDDLEQYIYLLLLEMDNNRINQLYHRNELRKFISQVIKNQRNLIKYSEYGKFIVGSESTGNNNIYQDDDNHDYIKDMKIDFIYRELNRYEFAGTGLTSMELKISSCYEVYKLKLKRGYTLKTLANHFNVSRSTIAEMIKFAKEKIKERWNEYFDSGNYDVDYKFMEYINNQ